MKISDKALLIAAGALLAASGAGVIAAAPDARETGNREQMVAGWQISDRASPQSGDPRRRTIHMMRSGSGWSIEYEAVAGAEAVAPASTYMVNVDAPENGSCSDGNSADVDEGTPEQRARLVRQRIADSIVSAQRACRRTADVSAAALAGFERAYEAADHWTAERRAVFDMEGAAEEITQAASDAFNETEAAATQRDDGGHSSTNDSGAVEPK